MAEWETRQVFPMCCAADLTAEVQDRLLEANKPGKGLDANLVIVDSMDKIYDKQPQYPTPAPSLTSSPFRSKTPFECHRLLKELNEKLSMRTGQPRISFEYFGILDERSMVDDTLLLIECSEYGGSQPKTVRAEFAEASLLLPALSIGHVSMEENQESARSRDDGVLRSKKPGKSV